MALELPQQVGLRHQPCLVFALPELVLENVLGNPSAEAVALLHRMAVVHSTEDSRAIDLGHHVLETCKLVRGAGAQLVENARQVTTTIRPE